MATTKPRPKLAPANNLHVREFLRERLLKTLLAQNCGSAARLVHHHPDLPCPADKLRDLARRGNARAEVVGCDERDIPLRIHAGIEYGNGDARFDRPLHRRGQRALIGRRDCDTAQMLRDHRVDNPKLARMVGLFIGAVPLHFNSEILGRLIHAGVNRNEE